MQKHVLPGLSAGLAAASIWGGMYVVSKVALEVVPPFALLALRLVLGAATLAGILAFQPKPALKKERAWASFWVGFLGYGVSLGFQFVGTKLSTASNGALVTSATPAFVLLFAPALLGEKTTARRLLALVLSSLGVAAVINPRSAEFSPSLFWGNLSLLAAALTWALYSTLARKISLSGGLLRSGAIMLLGGLPSSLALGAWEIRAQGVGEITPGVIGGILFLGIVSTALAMLMWNYAFAKLPAAVASLTFFAQPLVGTILGVLLLGEELSVWFIAGGILIGIGLIVAATDPASIQPAD
jgi:drug/metabolite transporter (DMT)-like permease